MSWVANYTKWRDSVVKNYGSLDQFPDAPSIRILLNIAEREVKELNAFFDCIPPETERGDEIIAEIRADLMGAISAKNELLQWLENKGLSR